MSPYEGDYAHVPGDRRKQLTESSGSTQGSWQPPMPQPEASEAACGRIDAHPEFNAFAARVLANPIARAAYERAELWAVIEATWEDELTEAEEELADSIATAVLSAGFVSPDRLASLLTEARAEALREAAYEIEQKQGLDDGLSFWEQMSVSPLDRTVRWLRARAAGGAR